MKCLVWFTAILIAAACSYLTGYAVPLLIGSQVHTITGWPDTLLAQWALGGVVEWIIALAAALALCYGAWLEETQGEEGDHIG